MARPSPLNSQNDKYLVFALGEDSVVQAVVGSFGVSQAENAKESEESGYAFHSVYRKIHLSFPVTESTEFSNQMEHQKTG